MHTRPLALVVAVAMLLSACGSDGSTEDQTASPTGDEAAPDGADVEATGEAGTRIRLVSPAVGADLLADRPPDLVVLDVRTAEEYADGHLADATMLDFYSDDFADRLADLDPERPYLIYCRSGNRSGQTRALMEELGFTDVADLDGGILAWAEAGLPVER